MATRTVNFKFLLETLDKIPWIKANHENWQEVDAVLARYTSVNNIQGVWDNSTAYSVGDRLVDGDLGTIWSCVVAHTSAGGSTTFASDRTTNPSFWENFTVDQAALGQWVTDTAYSINDFVFDGNIYAVAIVDHTSGATFAADSANWAYLIDASASVAAAAASAAAAAASASAAAGSAAGVNLPSIVAVGDMLQANGSATGYDILTAGATGLPVVSGGAGATVAYGALSAVGLATGSVAIAKIADNAVTLAKMASGTSGELISYDGSGDPVAVAVGSTGQVMTSNGSGSAPTMQAVDAKVLQVVSFSTGGVNTGTDLIPKDNTTPQSSEGTQYMTLAITPNASGNTLMINAIGHAANTVTNPKLTMALFQDVEASALSVDSSNPVSGNGLVTTLLINHVMIANTVAATTFKVHIGNNATGTTTLNGQGGSGLFNDTLASSIVITEIKA